MKKPLAAMESKDSHNIRFTESSWMLIEQTARERGLEPSAWARDLCLMMLTIVMDPELMEAHVKALSAARLRHHEDTGAAS